MVSPCPMTGTLDKLSSRKILIVQEFTQYIIQQKASCWFTFSSAHLFAEFCVSHESLLFWNLCLMLVPLSRLVHIKWIRKFCNMICSMLTRNCVFYFLPLFSGKERKGAWLGANV